MASNLAESRTNFTYAETALQLDDEMFDLSEKMKGAPAGRAVWNTYFKLWQAVPENMLPVIVEQIRKRKGLPTEPPTASEFIDNE